MSQEAFLRQMSAALGPNRSGYICPCTLRFDGQTAIVCAPIVADAMRRMGRHVLLRTGYDVRFQARDDWPRCRIPHVPDISDREDFLAAWRQPLEASA